MNMTTKANGLTYQSFIGNGWTDEQLIERGYMVEIVDGEGIAAEQLSRLVDRVERLEEEKADIHTSIKEIYLEAKSHGFDPKIMKKIVALRRLDPHQINEEEAILYLYKQALDMS